MGRLNDIGSIEIAAQLSTAVYNSSEASSSAMAALLNGTRVGEQEPLDDK